MSKPRITVGVMTYNRTALLREAVRSILNQSFTNFELVVSNDNPDVNITLCSLGINPDPRVRIVNQSVNLGVLDNMDFLLDAAAGEWFIWLSEDDLFHPDYLRFALDTVLHSDFDNPVGCFSNYLSAESPENLFPPVTRSSLLVVNSNQIGLRNFLHNYTLRRYPSVGECGLFKSEVLRRIGGMPRLGSGPGHFSDTLLPLLLLEHGSIYWTDYPFVFYRADQGSISHSSADLSAYMSAEVDFLHDLEVLCTKECINISTDKLVANMTKWFSTVEWQVLSRCTSVSKGSLFLRFFQIQISVHLPRLKLRYKVVHLFFILCGACRLVVNSLRGNFMFCKFRSLWH